MTEERKSILRGILNCIRLCNKTWKRQESEAELLFIFGKDDNVTQEEVNEFVKEAA